MQKNILILNLILTTAEKGVIKRRESIKDCMIVNIAEGFINNGYNVTIIASEEFKPTKEEKYNFEIIYFKSAITKIFKPHLIPFPPALFSYLNNNVSKYDMVLTSESFSLATLIASFYCKDKLVIWQELAYHQKLFFKLPSKIWHNIVLPLFMKKVLVIGRSQKAIDFISHYSDNVSNTVVDHGTNSKLFYPSSESDNSFVIIAQLIPRKNIKSMIQTFAKFIANSKYSTYKLHIIGDGPELNNLKELIKSLNLTENVIIHGFLRHIELSTYLRTSKGLLVNTLMDLNMVSIPESIVSGTPILTNSLPVTAPFIKDNNLGIVKDNWTEKELAEMVESYDKFHTSCINVRDSLTETECAKKIITIFNNKA